jgi:ferredoxin--NADP+ reductase
VILAIGAPIDRKLGIPGEDLSGVVGSAEFVGWYNGHPDFTDLDPPLDGSHAAVIGNGNVALDCARVLSKNHHEFEGSDIVGHALSALDQSPIHTVTIFGRRGPHQISMTPKELGELGHLEAATPVIDPADFPPTESDELLDPGPRTAITILREGASSGLDPSKSTRSVCDCFAKPERIEGTGKAERLMVERPELDASGAAKGTGEIYEVPASLIVTSIGYQTPRIDGVPYDERGGKFANDQGKIANGLYAVGWARRGPTGTIGTNRPDGYEVAEQVALAMPPGSQGGKPGGSGLNLLLKERGVEPTSFADWRKIEAAEVAAARPGSPREKFVRHADWLKILGR